jgi:chromosome segregation ATPase
MLSLASLSMSIAFAQVATPQTSIADMQNKLATVRGDVEQLLDKQADIYDQLDMVEAELELSSRLLRELRTQSRSIQRYHQHPQATVIDQ